MSQKPFKRNLSIPRSHFHYTTHLHRCPKQRIAQMHNYTTAVLFSESILLGSYSENDQ